MKKQKINNRPKLDLHGVFHKEVFSEVDKFVSENLYANEIEIVTGYSNRMKDLVQLVLSDYKLKGECPPYNDGTLIVKL